MGRGEQISRVTRIDSGLTPSVPVQAGSIKTIALAWAGGSRLEIGPSAGRALMKGAVKRIGKNMAGWLDVRYLQSQKYA